MKELKIPLNSSLSGLHDELLGALSPSLDIFRLSLIEQSSKGRLIGPR